MTKSEYSSKLADVLKAWWDGKIGLVDSCVDGTEHVCWLRTKADAVLYAYRIAFADEFVYRMANDSLEDDPAEDYEWLDECPAEWFLSELIQMAIEDDSSGYMFCTRDGEAFEYCKDAFEQIHRNWNDYILKEEGKKHETGKNHRKGRAKRT